MGKVFEKMIGASGIKLEKIWYQNNTRFVKSTTISQSDKQKFIDILNQTEAIEDFYPVNPSSPTYMFILNPDGKDQEKIKIKGDLLILSEGFYERVILPNFLEIIEKMLTGTEVIEKAPKFRAV